MIALDLFAGTGWGVACQRLGIEEHGVELMDEAVATRDAAGMTTLYRDVWEGLDEGKVVGNVRDILNTYQLLIASPPCQTFSVAGKGAGRKALDDVLGAIRFGAYKTPETLRAATEGLDDRTALVLTPLTYAYRDRPMLVVLEQVPTVLPVWEACAEVLRAIGYSVVTGVLNAEQYGVPQTRKRAILIARRDGVEAKMPTPTHSRYYSRSPEKLDDGVEKWVSMAEALGWGMTERPYPTVATGTEQGGTDPAALGGSGARRTVYGERERGAWEPSGDADNDGGILRLTDQDAAVLQSYPSGLTQERHRGAGMLERHGERPARPVEHPALTVTGSASGTTPGGFRVAGSAESWPYERPATTIVADPRLGGPGRSEFVKGGVSRQNRPGSMKLEDNQAAALQSYPDGFPFQGAKGKRFLQIGNAVPPLLGEAILSPLVEVAVSAKRSEMGLAA